MKTFVVILGLLAVSSAQMAIPKREVGFVYKSGSPTAPVHFDVYIDQICLDSQIAWPVVLEVADWYGPTRLRLTMRLFPLPHHRNGFTASRATHVIGHMTNASMVYLYTSKVFDKFDNLTQSATRHLRDDEVINILAEIAHSIGVPVARFKTLCEDMDLRTETVLEWRYGCTRGLTGTPRFMLNDVQIDASPRWSLADWKGVIDPLLA